MNFLLEFVSCYGFSSRDANNEDSSREVSGETKALMTDRTARRRKRGRVRSLSAGGGTVAEWKPSLGVISEDNSVVVVAAREVGKERILKRKSGTGGSREAVTCTGYTDNDRKMNHFVAVAAIPAFSPTPFMF